VVRSGLLDISQKLEMVEEYINHGLSSSKKKAPDNVTPADKVRVLP